MTTSICPENSNHKLRSATDLNGRRRGSGRKQESRTEEVGRIREVGRTNGAGRINGLGGATRRNAWRVLFLNRFKLFAFFPTGRQELGDKDSHLWTRKHCSSTSQEAKQRNVANQTMARRRKKASSGGKTLRNQSGSVVAHSVATHSVATHSIATHSVVARGGVKHSLAEHSLAEHSLAEHSGNQVGSAVLKGYDEAIYPTYPAVSGGYLGSADSIVNIGEPIILEGQAPQVKLGQFAKVPTSNLVTASRELSHSGETDTGRGKEASIDSLRERGRRMTDERSSSRSDSDSLRHGDSIVNNSAGRVGAVQLGRTGRRGDAADTMGISAHGSPRRSPEQELKLSNHPALSMLQTRLPLALVRKTLRPETIAAVRKLGVRDAVGDWSLGESEVAQVKRAFKEDLNIPDIFAIHIFTSPSGEGVLVNEFGEEVIDGCLLMEGVRGSVTFLALEVVCATSSIYIDGELVDSTEVPRRLSSLQNSLRRPRTLSEIVDFADARAQAIAFRGFINHPTDHREVLVMQNCIAPNDYHVFVGTPEAMTPIDLEPRATGFEHNFGVMLKGKSAVDGSAALLLMPANGSPLIKPSFNGKEVLPERLSRSGEPVLIGRP